MPRILRTTRRLPKETLELEPFLTLDAQGMPSHGSPVEFEANVLEYDAAVGMKGAEFIIVRDGSRVETPLTLYVQGDATDVPAEQDRVIRGSGSKFIVAEKKTVSGLLYTAAQPDHYRLRCRVE
jgi:hypothetical protein